MAASARPIYLLPTIVIAQFAGTSLWFAGNAILPDLQASWGLAEKALGSVTNAVQIGFIAGTLVFAFLTIADRYSPRKIYLLCSVLGGMATGASAFIDGSLFLFLVSRFLTGFFLAGIYPVGMKIAAGWYQKDLGRALGFIIAALVVGTALPHLLRGLGQSLPWESVMLAVAGTAMVGGLVMFVLVPDGPYLKGGTAFNPRAFSRVFRSAKFRASSFGYFGHMWELYALWAFLPVLLAAYKATHQEMAFNVSIWSFIFIAIGALGCAGGGILSRRFGSERVAFYQLFASLICCACVPVFYTASPLIFFSFLAFWVIVVIGDSPQLSTLSAQFADPVLVGVSLTLVNCLGFSISVVSVYLLNLFASCVEVQYLFLLLIPGPVFGLWSMWFLVKRTRSSKTA